MELNLIIKTLNESFAEPKKEDEPDKPEPLEELFEETAGQKILGRMLSEPYATLFGDKKNIMMALVPPKVFHIRQILVPRYNLNCVSSSEKNMVGWPLGYITDSHS